MSSLKRADEVIGLPLELLENAKTILSYLEYEAEERCAVNAELSNLHNDVDLLSGTIARAESVGITEDNDDRVRTAKSMLLRLLTLHPHHTPLDDEEEDFSITLTPSNPLDVMMSKRRSGTLSPEKMDVFCLGRGEDDDDDDDDGDDDSKKEVKAVNRVDEETQMIMLSRICREKCSVASSVLASSVPTGQKISSARNDNSLRRSPETSPSKVESIAAVSSKSKSSSSQRGSIFRERNKSNNNKMLFRRKSTAHELRLDENTTKEYANTARRCMHLLWHVFTYYTLKYSPEDPYHMTMNGALSFVRDCCCDNVKTRRKITCGGCVTRATSSTFVNVLRNGLLGAGTSGRLMFGDFVRLVSSVSAPCTDAVCMYVVFRSIFLFTYSEYSLVSLTHHS